MDNRPYLPATGRSSGTNVPPATPLGDREDGMKNTDETDWEKLSIRDERDRARREAQLLHNELEVIYYRVNELEVERTSLDSAIASTEAQLELSTGLDRDPERWTALSGWSAGTDPD